MVAKVKKGIEKCRKCGEKYKRVALVCGLCALCENERVTKQRRVDAKRKRLRDGACGD